MNGLTVAKALCVLMAGLHAAQTMYRSLSSVGGSKTASQKGPETPRPQTDRNVMRRFPRRTPARFAMRRRCPVRGPAARPGQILPFRRVARFLRPSPPWRSAGHRPERSKTARDIHAGSTPSTKGEEKESTLGLFRNAWQHFTDFEGLCDYALESPAVLGHFIMVAFVEEVIWRVAAQTIVIEFLQAAAGPFLGVFGNAVAAAAGILIVAVLFAVSHRHFFENAPLVSAEFLGFAILLGVLYYWTSSFVLVIVIHALRDVEITFLEYQIRSEEVGSSELAARQVEHSVIRNSGMRRMRRKDLLIQLPAFYLSCFLGYWVYDAFTRDLISPVHIAAGLAAGHLVFGISLLITLHSVETA